MQTPLYKVISSPRESAEIRDSSRIQMDLTTLQTYQSSVIAHIAEAVSRATEKPLAEVSMADLKIPAIQAQILKDSRVDTVKLDFDREHLYVFDPKTMQTESAKRAILNGTILMEHTAAGEATRLAMGTKYVITPQEVIDAIDSDHLKHAADDAEAKKNKTLTAAQRAETHSVASGLLPISLGVRHLMQTVLDIRKLAVEHGENLDEVVALQIQLIVVNAQTADQIISELERFNFLGFSRDNVFFLVQEAMPGYVIEGGEVKLEASSVPRLHNHGAMKMQQVMDNQIFHLSPSGEKIRLSFGEYKAKVSHLELGISYNIEDTDHIQTSALDLPAIALGLQSGEEGYGMVMTSVSQKTPPLDPQKGGFFAYSNSDDRIYCFESDVHPGFNAPTPAADVVTALRGITYLNKNVNMYPHPAQLLETIKDRACDLPTHTTLKDGVLYPQPPQGDLNFLLKTRVITEAEPKAIRSLKEQSDILDTVRAMQVQDNRQEFVGLARRYGIIA